MLGYGYSQQPSLKSQVFMIWFRVPWFRESPAWSLQLDMLDNPFNNDTVEEMVKWSVSALLIVRGGG